MKILLVVPKSAVRQTLERLLDFEGYDLLSVQNKEEALELVRIKRFGLILLDPSAETMTTEEFIEALPAGHAPVGLISDSARVEKMAKALGLELFVRVPFDPEEFLGHVESLARVQGLSPRPMGTAPVVLH